MYIQSVFRNTTSCFKFIIFLTYVLTLTACSCEKSFNCPPLSQNGIIWLGNLYNDGDSITFGSSSNEKIKLHRTTNHFTDPYIIQESCESEGFKCNCDHDCTADGYFVYESDTINNLKHTLMYRYGDKSSNNGIYYSSFGFTMDDLSVSYYVPYQNSPSDSFFTSIEINGQTYQDIYVTTLDTVRFSELSVWKSYFSRNEGLIAFWKRPLQQLFVRE